MWSSEEQLEDQAVNLWEGKSSSTELRTKSGKMVKKYLTKFSMAEMLELQRLVQGECVGGQMTEARMIRVYEDIFPMGSVTKYVKIIFAMLDSEQVGSVKCGQFLQFISVMARGGVGERAEMVFRIFDVRREGVLKKEDFQKVKVGKLSELQLSLAR